MKTAVTAESADRDSITGMPMEASIRVKEKRVLVVDDDRRIVEVLARVMELKGYHVLTASDGVEAMRVLRAETVDLVILDCMMPEMSGEELCKEIRGKEDERHLPIIMVSGKSKDADRIVAKVVGADYYLTKPFDLQVLLQLVKELIGANPI